MAECYRERRILGMLGLLWEGEGKGGRGREMEKGERGGAGEGWQGRRNGEGERGRVKEKRNWEGGGKEEWRIGSGMDGEKEELGRVKGIGKGRERGMGKGGGEKGGGMGGGVILAS